MRPELDSCDPLAALMTEQEQQVWEALITVVLSLPVVLDRQLQTSEGLSHFEFSILARLLRGPESGLRLSDLAMQTGSTLPRLSKAMTRCENEGWARRRPDPSDGRSTLATITSAGCERLATTTPDHVALVRRLVFSSSTPAALKNLGSSLARIADAIRGELY